MDKNLFRGELVQLTAARPGDAEVMAQWSENSAYLRLVDTDYARPRPARDFEDKAEAGPDARNAIEFRIRAVSDGRLLGFVALHNLEWHNQTGELSIGIGDPNDWNRGYGTEALRLTLRYAFTELNLFRVGLNTIAYNQRAIRAYEKVGFVREGVWRSFGLRDGQRYDVIMMSILRDEWRESAES
jgi:RimJ/RimL family protein N-acetyltransferase